eukprot:GEMP01057991.1.p1 GENE.GEMP01057991.1~~GEMP01057991.1.p1  ORF type:complete len:342 (+),score=-9.98 GEMP01057991.1:89-1114(+)
MVSVERGVGALALLLLLFHLAHTQSATCEHECIPVFQCAQLYWLFLHPSSENTDTLQRNTCSYKNGQPIVCCPRNAIKFPKTCGVSDHRGNGGRELPIDGYAWKALLGYRDTGSSKMSFLCAGSVISERYILTSAHCVHGSILGPKNVKVVRVGEWDRSTEPDCMRNLCAPPAQDFNIEEVISHPNYNKRGQFSDDIALLRLVSPIDLNGLWIASVCLPPQSTRFQDFSIDRHIYTAGWGVSNLGTATDRPQHVAVSIVDRATCNETYRGNILEEQICAGGHNNEVSCVGDGGSALLEVEGLYFQIGILSYGPVSCGGLNVPEVYTSVSHYRLWIDVNMKP